MSLKSVPFGPDTFFCPSRGGWHASGTQVLWSRRRRIALGGFESLELFSPDFALRLQLDALSHQLDHLRLVASLKVRLGESAQEWRRFRNEVNSLLRMDEGLVQLAVARGRE